MKKFYAVYDNKDNFIDCGFSSKELGIDASTLWRGLKGKNGIKIYEIPLTPQKDVFQEEDLLFLEEEYENCFTALELAERQGISIRTFYRWRQKNEIRRHAKSDRNFGR